MKRSSVPVDPVAQLRALSCVDKKKKKKKQQQQKKPKTNL